MSHILIIVFFAWSFPTPECSERGEWQGDSGGWIEAESLTEQNARAALEHLEQYVNGEIQTLSASGYELDISLKYLEGFIRKRLVHHAVENGDPMAEAVSSSFCIWLERRGFYLGQSNYEAPQTNKSLQLTAFGGSRS